VGREPIKFLSEEYCKHALSRSATWIARNNNPLQHTSVVRKLISRTLREINDLISCFSFKLSESIGVFC